MQHWRREWDLNPRCPEAQWFSVDLQEHLNAAQDHNLELNRAGVKTQSQTAPNAVDDQ